MNEISTQNIDYNFFKNIDSNVKLSKEETFKEIYKKEANRVFEEQFTKIGRWGLCKRNNINGILTDDGDWDPLNRVNTNPVLYQFFYNEFLKSNPNSFTDFGNPKYHNKNVGLIWKFLEDNFDLYFTQKISSEHYRKIYSILSRSWAAGNIPMVISTYHLKSAFPNLKEIDYSFNTGEIEDLKGVDIKILLDNGESKTFQVKRGDYQEARGFCFVNGATNNFKYTCDYYIYAKAKTEKDLSQIIIFKNLNEFKKTKFGSLMVSNKDIIYKTKQFMSVPENLQKLMEICGNNDIEFIIQQEDNDSYANFNEEKMCVTVNFIGPEDKTLLEKIQNTIKQLQERFK